MKHPPISIRSILFIRHISTRDIYRLLCEGLLCHSEIDTNGVQLQCLPCSNDYEHQLTFQTSPAGRPDPGMYGRLIIQRMSLNQQEMSVLTAFSWLRAWLQIAKFIYLPYTVIKYRYILKIQTKSSALRTSDTSLSQTNPLYPISLWSSIKFAYAYEFQILFPSSFSTKLVCAFLISPIWEPRI